MELTEQSLAENFEEAASHASDLSVCLGVIWKKLELMGQTADSDEWRSRWSQNHRLIDLLNDIAEKLKST